VELICLCSTRSETGHVVNKNFTTDVILKRVSKTLVETVNHEFYELRGPLSDNKHSEVSKIRKNCALHGKVTISFRCRYSKEPCETMSQWVSLEYRAVLLKLGNFAKR